MPGAVEDISPEDFTPVDKTVKLMTCGCYDHRPLSAIGNKYAVNQRKTVYRMIISAGGSK
jgi:hypothetical protein